MLTTENPTAKAPTNAPVAAIWSIVCKTGDVDLVVICLRADPSSIDLSARDFTFGGRHYHDFLELAYETRSTELIELVIAEGSHLSLVEVMERKGKETCDNKPMEAEAHETELTYQNGHLSRVEVMDRMGKGVCETNPTETEAHETELDELQGRHEAEIHALTAAHTKEIDEMNVALETSQAKVAGLKEARWVSQWNVLKLKHALQKSTEHINRLEERSVFPVVHFG